VAEIYNSATHAWTTSTLSQARYNSSAAGAGNDIVFGGGLIRPNFVLQTTSTVDIYNTATNTWTASNLSQSRSWLAATSLGNNVYFGGGESINSNSDQSYSNAVDIFDTTAGTWSTATLSQARYAPTAAALGTKVFFAGGNVGNFYSNVVDIYDTSTKTWSTAALSTSRDYAAAAAAGNKVLFAGGEVSNVTTYTNAVDIYTLQSYTSISSSKTFTLVDNTTVTGLMQQTGGSLGLGGYSLAVGSMAGAAPINLSGGTLTAGTDNSNSSYSGMIQGAGRFVKTGAGTLTLSGSNTYSGPTTVGQGKLTVNGAVASAVTVGSTGALGGTGTLSSAIINAGGHLAPGDSPGTLHLSGSLSLLFGAKMDYELATPLGSDEVLMPTSLLALNDQQFSDFTFTPLGGFGPGSYTLIDAGSISGNLGANTTGIISGLPATLAIQGSDLVLNVVPEPGTLVLLGCGAMAFLSYRCKRMLRRYAACALSRGVVLCAGKAESQTFRTLVQFSGSSGAAIGGHPGASGSVRERQGQATSKGCGSWLADSIREKSECDQDRVNLKPILIQTTNHV
jgi:autotransporter-associated beta strand protein